MFQLKLKLLKNICHCKFSGNVFQVTRYIPRGKSHKKCQKKFKNSQQMLKNVYKCSISNKMFRVCPKMFINMFEMFTNVHQCVTDVWQCWQIHSASYEVHTSQFWCMSILLDIGDTLVDISNIFAWKSFWNVDRCGRMF